MKTISTQQNLDIIFDALASKHRREMVYALSLHPHSISQLAAMRDLSLPAIHKHIRILVNSGFVKTKKIGRIHFLALNRQSLLQLQDWVMQYRAYWGSDDETLENYAQYIKKKPKKGGDKK